MICRRIAAARLPVFPDNAPGRRADPPGQHARALARRLDAGVLVGRRDLDGPERRRDGPADHPQSESRSPAQVLARRQGDRVRVRSRRVDAGVRDARRRLGFAQANHLPYRGIAARGVFSRRSIVAGERPSRPLLALGRSVLQGRSRPEGGRGTPLRRLRTRRFALARWQETPVHARGYSMVAQGISRVSAIASLALRSGGEDVHEAARSRRRRPVSALETRWKGILLCRRERRLVQPLGIRDRGQDEQGVDVAQGRFGGLSVHQQGRLDDRLPPPVRPLSLPAGQGRRPAETDDYPGR